VSFLVFPATGAAQIECDLCHLVGLEAVWLPEQVIASAAREGERIDEEGAACQACLVLHDVALAEGWTIHDDKHRCPRCKQELN
jgi:uncharacterized paraquat-inducible protein A